MICAICSLLIQNSSLIQKCKRREYYHNETQTCYKHMTKGPCKGNMLFLKLDKVFGDCDCSEDEPVPWVYHPETNDCYETYKQVGNQLTDVMSCNNMCNLYITLLQSYCSADQWLIFDAYRKPICAPNSCKSEPDGNHPTVFLKNKCVSVSKPSDACGPSEEVGFKRWDVFPECISTIAEQSVIGTNQLRCRPGMRRDSNGMCRRTIVVAASEE